jgi:hypothetical protein
VSHPAELRHHFSHTALSSHITTSVVSSRFVSFPRQVTPPFLFLMSHQTCDIICIESSLPSASLVKLPLSTHHAKCVTISSHCTKSEFTIIVVFFQVASDHFASRFAKVAPSLLFRLHQTRAIISVSSLRITSSLSFHNIKPHSQYRVLSSSKATILSPLCLVTPKPHPSFPSHLADFHRHFPLASLSRAITSSAAPELHQHFHLTSSNRATTFISPHKYRHISSSHVTTFYFLHSIICISLSLSLFESLSSFSSHRTK